MEETIIWLKEEHLAGEEHASSSLGSPYSTPVKHCKHLEMLAASAGITGKEKTKCAETIPMHEHKRNQREKLIPQSFKMITLTFIFTHSVLHSFIFYMRFLLHSGSQESAGADPSCQVPSILTLNNNIDNNIIMFCFF